MNESWRGTYRYRPVELIEYLRDMRRGNFKSDYLLLREIYLQAQEHGLIKLPEGTVNGDCHLIPFSQLTILNDAINNDDAINLRH